MVVSFPPQVCIFLCLAIGFSPPEASTMTMEDNPSYSAVQEGLVVQQNPAYEQISG